MRKRLVLVIAVVALLAGSIWWTSRANAPKPYTGFVDGEERIIRAETSGRVLEVPYGEGAMVPANGVVARLADTDVAARIAAKRAEIDTIAAQLRQQDEQIALVEATWRRERAAREAAVRQAQAAADHAVRSFAREQELVKTGASTAQRLDDERSARDQAVNLLAQAREALGRVQAEERQIALARHQKDVLGEQQRMATAQLETLEVERAKCIIHGPGVETVVQTQLVWPGELAQPGTPIVAVLDPHDKYVQIYVPVEDTSRFPLGRRVEFEPDSMPGRRFPGEVSFVADRANFTPEKIETRGDRLGQVYRAKVRILDGVATLQPGTEGNVWLVGDTR